MTKAASKTAETETKAPKGKASKAARWGEADPHDLRIVGLDPGYREGESGFNAELYEADRIGRPSDDAVAMFREHGCDPVCVIRNTLGALIVAKGRQRTMSARIVADTDKTAIKVFYFVQETSDALDVTRENEFRKVRTPLEKANHAARLARQGYKEAEILSAFSTDGAKNITKMTLINWKRAANCCPAIQARCEAGEIAITVLYEIGKIGYNDKDMSAEDKTAKQLDALAKIEAEGGTLKGKAGRRNASEAAESSGETDEGSGEADEGSGGGKRAKSAKLSPEVLREMAKTFEADEEEPFTDKLRAVKDGPLVPSREYVDGDYQKITGALLAAIVGDDPSGEGLRDFPSVYKHVKRYLRYLRSAT